MIKDFEQYDKTKIEGIIEQRRESSRGGVNHNHHNHDNFYTSLCGMINAFFRESNEHQYEDISGYSKILCQRLKRIVCEEANKIYKDCDYIATYTILVHYILNDINWRSIYKDKEIKDSETFKEPKEYMKDHLESKLNDMFVIPKECNIEAYKMDTVR